MTVLTSGAEALISVRNLTKTYNLVGADEGDGEGKAASDLQVHALRGVTLDVHAGEFVALTGPSGSGKSTFMHLVGCLDRPSGGQYFLNGADVSVLGKRQLSHVRNTEIGFVFQGFNLLPRTSAIENVELPLLYAGTRSARERRTRAAAALESVGLGQRMGHHPNQLSGGQQQRVAIARALVNNPKLLLADEPTGNLDTRTSIEVMGIFQRLNQERGLTIVLVTHEPDIAEYGTRIVAFRDGRVKTDDPVVERRSAAIELAKLQTETAA
jgi:putative ABC transport system ATP-binding protein